MRIRYRFVSGSGAGFAGDTMMKITQIVVFVTLDEEEEKGTVRQLLLDENQKKMFIDEMIPMLFEGKGSILVDEKPFESLTYTKKENKCTTR